MTLSEQIAACEREAVECEESAAFARDYEIQSGKETGTPAVCLASAATFRAIAETLRGLVRPMWRHTKRGTVYSEIGRAELQCSDDAVLYEGTSLVVYCGEDGKLWARPDYEFTDGRFVSVPPPPEPAP